MKTFLSLVAEDLLKQYGTDMRHVTVVFPSKRAGLFLSQELQAISTKPVWAPRYTTMGELFKQFSTRLIADPIDCICLLYQLYIKYVGNDILNEEGKTALEYETLDRFWGWGEILMADFDDIDKHLANPKQVFRHIHDLAELQDLSYLDDEQKKILTRFFGYFSEHDNSLIRKRFIRLWDKMLDIYNELKALLLSENQLWEGAIYREVYEQIKKNPSITSQVQDICFVGFNVLNNVEEELMKALSPRARFYWDYDEYYTKDTTHEAGEFMRRNLNNFQSALPTECFRNLQNLKEITYITCTTDNVAARYTSQWLKNGVNETESKNAIVLCNEQLMLPVLHSIPDDQQSKPREINITMGFPLSDTPIYSLINSLLSLQTDGWDEQHKRFRYNFAQNVKQHPYAEYISEEKWLIYKGNSQYDLLQYIKELLESVGIFYAQKNFPNIFEQLYIESIFQTHRIIQKFQQLISKPESSFVVQNNTLRKLLRNVMSSTSIPFHGEPATGLQIMGVLETRCLDFSHLLMLSVEEDKLPRNTQQNSLIPPVVREVYGLTTPRHKICIFAYYFYRLIQRCEHLTCVYNENCVGVEHHEISRFLRQLMAEQTPEQLKLNKFSLESKPNYTIPSVFEIKKSDKILNKLNQKYTLEYNEKPRYLSPTAINSYTHCPMQFYFRYIEELHPLDEKTDEIDAPVFGNIFHDAAEIFYLDLLRRNNNNNQRVEKSFITPFLQKENTLLRQYIDLSFDLNVFHPYTNEKEKKQRIDSFLTTSQKTKNIYIGQTIIIRDVLLRYLKNLVRCDYNLAPFTIHSLEMECKTSLEIEVYGEKRTILTGGRIDRLDELEDGTLRVFDYKTGTPKQISTDYSTLFERGEKHSDYVFQTYLYALALKKSDKWSKFKNISPALFYVRKSNDENYDPRIYLKSIEDEKVKTSNFCDFADDFQTNLYNLLNEIFSPDIPFTQTTEREVCNKCDFALLCNRLKTRKDN